MTTSILNEDMMMMILLPPLHLCLMSKCVTPYLRQVYLGPDHGPWIQQRHPATVSGIQSSPEQLVLPRQAALQSLRVYADPTLTPLITSVCGIETHVTVHGAIGSAKPSRTCASTIEMNEQFNWYKMNQPVQKGIQHLHVSKQATKISEIRLHYLGYNIKHNKKTFKN